MLMCRVRPGELWKVLSQYLQENVSREWDRRCFSSAALLGQVPLQTEHTRSFAAGGRVRVVLVVVVVVVVVLAGVVVVMAAIRPLGDRVGVVRMGPMGC